jgi:hypothetical protein
VVQAQRRHTGVMMDDLCLSEGGDKSESDSDEEGGEDESS